MSHAPEQLEMWSVDAAPEKRAPLARCALASGWPCEAGDDVWGETAVSRARWDFWWRNGPRLAGRVFRLRRDVISMFDGPEVCRAGWVVEWKDRLGFRCRRRVGGMIVGPNLYLLRPGDISSANIKGSRGSAANTNHHEQS